MGEGRGDVCRAAGVGVGVRDAVRLVVDGDLMQQ